MSYGRQRGRGRRRCPAAAAVHRPLGLCTPGLQSPCSAGEWEHCYCRVSPCWMCCTATRPLHPPSVCSWLQQLTVLLRADAREVRAVPLNVSSGKKESCTDRRGQPKDWVVHASPAVSLHLTDTRQSCADQGKCAPPGPSIPQPVCTILLT